MCGSFSRRLSLAFVVLVNPGAAKFVFVLGGWEGGGRKQNPAVPFQNMFMFFNVVPKRFTQFSFSPFELGVTEMHLWQPPFGLPRFAGMPELLRPVELANTYLW